MLFLDHRFFFASSLHIINCLELRDDTLWKLHISVFIMRSASRTSTCIQVSMWFYFLNSLKGQNFYVISMFFILKNSCKHMLSSFPIKISSETTQFSRNNSVLNNGHGVVVTYSCFNMYDEVSRLLIKTFFFNNYL